MEILYISQYFPPEIGAPAARASELARHWTREGHKVTILTGFPNHPSGKIPSEYKKAFRRLFAKEKFDGVKVVRTWLLPFPNRKPYERMLNYVSFLISSAITGMFISRPEVVIATSPQLLVGLSGWWLARWNRVPFVFEVRDLWPESLSAVGVGNHKSLLYRALRRIASFLYRRADHIVVVTSAFKDHLVQHWNVPAGKISIVQNGVETDIFSPRNSDPSLRDELQAEGKFVVSYVGTIGIAHGLDSLIETASMLQDTAPDVLFLLVGDGADKDRISALARSRGLTNLRLVGPQPRERIPAFIAASDACLVLLKKADIFQTVIPTKMLEFMSCARPVVLGVEGQARKMIESAAAGIWVAPEAPDQLAKAILQLAGNRALSKQLGENGRKYILEQLSRKQTADDYIVLLEKLTGTRTQVRAAAA